MPHAAACTTLEDVDVECTYCGVRMSSHVGSGGQIRYFHCPSCSRWTTSTYAEVLRADTKMRARRPSADAARPAFGSVKERLEAWLQALSFGDPYRVLGVSPSDSEAAIRERYLALARQHHPDRGGRTEDMHRVNEAYEQVLLHRERQRSGLKRPAPLPSGA